MPRGKAAIVVDEYESAIDWIDPEKSEVIETPVGTRTTKTVEVKTEALTNDDEPRPRRQTNTSTLVDSPKGDVEKRSPFNFFTGDDSLGDFYNNEDNRPELVEVYRNPTAGGSPRSGRMSFVGQFPNTDSLLTDIRASCGGGSFTIIARGINEDGHKGIIGRTIQPIEGAPKEYALSPTNSATAAPVAPVAATAAMPAAELPKDETRVWFNDLTKRVLEKSIERALDPPTTAQVATVEKPPSFTAQLAETTSIITAITKAAQQISPPAPAQPPAPSSGWLGDLASFINALGVKDFVAPLVEGMMAKQAGAQDGAATNGAIHDAAATGDDLPPHHQFVSVLVDLIMRNDEPPVAVALTLDFASRYPDYAAFIGQLRTLTPVELLEKIISLDPSWALLKKLPHSAGWLQDYQEALNAAFEPVVTPTEQPNAAAKKPNAAAKKRSVVVPGARRRSTPAKINAAMEHSVVVPDEASSVVVPDEASSANVEAVNG